MATGRKAVQSLRRTLYEMGKDAQVHLALYPDCGWGFEPTKS